MNFISVFLISCFLRNAVQAEMLVFSGAESNVEKVKVFSEAKVTNSDHEVSLKLLGTGLRYKKVAFFKADVYLGQFYVTSLDGFSKTREGALTSIDTQKAIALRLTFLRNVEGEKVKSSFVEALKENQVSLEDSAVKSLLEAVATGGEVKEKSSIVFFGEKVSDSKERLVFENSKGGKTTLEGGKGFVRSVFSIWFGKLDDSGLEFHRDSILGLVKK